MAPRPVSEVLAGAIGRAVNEASSASKGGLPFEKVLGEGEATVGFVARTPSMEASVICAEGLVTYALVSADAAFGTVYATFEDLAAESPSSLSARVRSDFFELFRSVAAYPHDRTVTFVPPSFATSATQRTSCFLTAPGWLSARQEAPVALFYDPATHAGGMTYLRRVVDLQSDGHARGEGEADVGRMARIRFLTPPGRVLGQARNDDIELCVPLGDVADMGEAHGALREACEKGLWNHA